MEYGVLGNTAATAAAAQRLNQPTPELGRLKHAAERISMATDRVGAFLGRFNGQFPPAGGTGGNSIEASGYRNDLDSVFAQLERLEQAVGALDGIG
jgi:hypothetical protein